MLQSIIFYRYHVSGQSNTLMAHQPKQSKSGIDRYSIPLWPGGGNGGLIDPHVPSSPPTDTCIPQNNHSTSNSISFFAVSDLLRLFPAVSGHILPTIFAFCGQNVAKLSTNARFCVRFPLAHRGQRENQKVVFPNTS